MTPVITLFSRAERLKQHITEITNNIEQIIAQNIPYSNKANYIKLLTLQYVYQHELSGLYQHAELNQYIDNLTKCNHLTLITEELISLGKTLPINTIHPPCFMHSSFANSLGWLYVIEGVKVASEKLAHQVVNELTLSEQFATRYLSKVAQNNIHCQLNHLIDNLELNKAQEQVVINGALQALAHFQFHQVHIYS